MKHCAYVQVELFMARLTFDSFAIFSVLNCMEFENIVVDYSIISSATKRKAFFQTISVKTISSVVTALQNSENNYVSSAITCAARYWLLKQCARFSVTTAGIMGSTTSNAIHFEIWNLHVRFEPAPATQDSVLPSMPLQTIQTPTQKHCGCHMRFGSGHYGKCSLLYCLFFT